MLVEGLAGPWTDESPEDLRVVWYSEAAATRPQVYDLAQGFFANGGYALRVDGALLFSLAEAHRWAHGADRVLREICDVHGQDNPAQAGPGPRSSSR